MAISASAMPGRDVGEGGLAHVREAAERVHDAPHRAEQADVRRHGTDGGEPGEMRVERVDLALERGAHRAARAVHRHRGGAALLPVLRVFAEAGGEDVLEAAAACATCWSSGRARSGRRLSRIRSRTRRCPSRVRFSWNILRKICHHDHSDRTASSSSTAWTTSEACAIEREEGEVGVDVQARLLQSAGGARAGMRAGRKVARSTQASVTRASVSRRSRRATPAAVRPCARGRVR